MPVSIKDARKIKVKPIPFDDPWFKFLGNLPLEMGWNGTLFGPSFHGKSLFAYYLSMNLSQFGPVLFVNAEENSPKGTLKTKLDRNNIRSLKYEIDLADENDWEELEKLIGSGKYKFVVRDSIHALAQYNDMKVLDLWKKFTKFPNIGFVDILFSMKDEKNFKGESDMLHLSEFAVECKKNKAGLPIARMVRKNRYKDNPEKHKYLDFIHSKVLKEVHDEK